MFPDKHTWEAEYFIEQGNKSTTYQVAYVEANTSKRKYLEDNYFFYGHSVNVNTQFKSIGQAHEAAIKHAKTMSEKRNHGKVLVELGKLP